LSKHPNRATGVVVLDAGGYLGEIQTQKPEEGGTTMTSKLALAALALTMLDAGPVAATTVDEVLAVADANLTKVEDQTYTASLEVVRDGKTIKTIEFVAKLKGLKKRLVKFTAPGDLRDMAILTDEDGFMYVYMPSYKRVRRVAAHVRNQGFMGTDLSPEEMGNAALSVGWNAKIAEEDVESWVLEMTPKPETDTTFSRRIVTVSKKQRGVSRIESYDARGKLIKSEERSEWKSFGPVHVPMKFVVMDHRTGSRTIMHFKNCVVNQGLPDSAFSKRALMRGD
jgi:outer membrane lipoprotein-sorting protein